MTFSKAVTIPANPTDEELANALMPLYVDDRDRFMRAVVAVKHANRHCRPLFPEGIDVTAVPRIPEADVPEFKKKYINDEKLYWKSEEAKKRCKDNARPLMYRRWRWAVENVDTFINMLRVYGHPDEKIQRMFEGVPMCFPTREDYDKLRVALKQLSADMAEEMGWGNVGFVITGSSVPGFSQNPCKGFENIPSKITDPTESDVDICVVADGVNVTVADRRSEGQEENEPKLAFHTTVTELLSGMRFGCKDISQFSKVAGDFQKKWGEILPGGLQLTFCEDDTDIPPWEARIDIRSI